MSVRVTVICNHCQWQLSTCIPDYWPPHSPYSKHFMSNKGFGVTESTSAVRFLCTCSENVIIWPWVHDIHCKILGQIKWTDRLILASRFGSKILWSRILWSKTFKVSCLPPPQTWNSGAATRTGICLPLTSAWQIVDWIVRVVFPVLSSSFLVVCTSYKSRDVKLKLLLGHSYEIKMWRIWTLSLIDYIAAVTRKIGPQGRTAKRRVLWSSLVQSPSSVSIRILEINSGSLQQYRVI